MRSCFIVWSLIKVGQEGSWTGGYEVGRPAGVCLETVCLAPRVRHWHLCLQASFRRTVRSERETVFQDRGAYRPVTITQKGDIGRSHSVRTARLLAVIATGLCRRRLLLRRRLVAP